MINVRKRGTVIMDENSMIESSCHCGLLKLQIAGDLPEALTSCNCSVCRKYGSLMAYFPASKVNIIAEPGAADRMGVNARLFENVDISQIRIRRFDGAQSWKYLD